MTDAPGFSGNNGSRRLQKLRERIGNWQYKAARQSFNRNTKKCGFYDSTNESGNGGPDGTNENSPNGAGFTDLAEEQTQLTTNDFDGAPDTLDDMSGPRRRRSLNGEEDFRYDRDDPCTGIRQIQNGFKKWAHRYIGACGGQVKEQHQFKRAEKLYGIFTGALECNSPKDLWSP